MYTGRFAERLLDECPEIETYYMIDPWRHLDAWNKPANRDDAAFEKIYRQARRRTKTHTSKLIVLRGTTREVIEELPAEGLDFAYVDGDHSLRGITVDLVSIFPKIRAGGWIGGDDFRPFIHQHGETYEPTLVFPFAVYFAEAVGARIYGLPYRQFLLEKNMGGFEFVDLTGGRFRTLDLRSQLRDVRRKSPQSRQRPSARLGMRVTARMLPRRLRARYAYR